MALAVHEKTAYFLSSSHGKTAFRRTEIYKGSKMISMLIIVQEMLLSLMLRLSCTTVVIWYCISQSRLQSNSRINAAVTPKCQSGLQCISEKLLVLTDRC